MEKLEWRSEYSVGVALFDEQHRRLMGMINRLIDVADSDGPPVDVKAAGRVASNVGQEMVAYAEEHFRAEEDAMARYDYPDEERHRLEHDEFIRRTASLREAGRLRRQSVPEAMLIYLKEWFVEHILKVDMNYRDFFSGKEIP